jgi:hypothetical protein
MEVASALGLRFLTIRPDPSMNKSFPKPTSGASGSPQEQSSLAKCPMCGFRPQSANTPVGKVIACRVCGGYFRAAEEPAKTED